MAEGTTSTNQANILKQIYFGKVESLIQTETTFVDNYLTEGPERPVGDGAYFAIHIGFNASGGAQNPDEALPVPQNQRTRKAVVRPKVYTSSNEWEGLIEDTASGGAASFVDVVDFDIEESLRYVRKQMNIDVFRDGRGVISTANATVTADTTVPVDDPHLFFEGQRVDFYNSAGTTLKAANRQVVSIATDFSSIEVDVAVTLVSGDLIVRKNHLVDAPADGKAVGGLERAIDDGTVATTYLGIDRTAITRFQGMVLDAASGTITADLMQRLLDRIRVRSANFKGSGYDILTNVGQRRMYLDVVTPLVQYTGNVGLDAGYGEPLKWNGHKWMIDVDCQQDRLWMIKKGAMQKFTVRALGMDMNGGNLRKQRDGYDSKWAYAKYYGNVAVRNPAATGVIENLAFRPL